MYQVFLQDNQSTEAEEGGPGTRPGSPEKLTGQDRRVETEVTLVRCHCSPNVWHLWHQLQLVVFLSLFFTGDEVKRRKVVDLWDNAFPGAKHERDRILPSFLNFFRVPFSGCMHSLIIHHFWQHETPLFISIS